MGIRPLIDFKKKNIPEANEEPKEENENVEQEQQQDNEDPVAAYKKEYARKLGWTDKDEWTNAGRDEAMWRDHEVFLDSSPAYFERLRKKNKEYKNSMERNAAAAAATIEEERKRIREDAIKEAREAATAGDPDRAAQAAERAATAGPPPETEAWIARNPWFNSDPEAQAVAIAAVNRAAKAGATIQEQLEAAGNSVKKRYPEHFEEDELDELPEFITRQPKRQQEEPQREVRMSESKKVAAAAASPASSARIRTPSQNKVKGFSDIPKADQELYSKYYARKFQSRNLTPEQAQERYANSYWKNIS